MPKGIQVTNRVEDRIFTVRNKRVMLDKDLADLYQVETKALNRAVKRNRQRFPKDFMFLLTNEEVRDLRCQFGTSKKGGRRYLPYAFTDYGILMLSSVLNSERAVQVNIQIVRIFMRFRELAMNHRDLFVKIGELEKKYDKQFLVVFKAIKVLLEDGSKRDREEGKRFEI